MKKLFFALFFFIPNLLSAQTLKTDVLVIGNTDAAYAAALQSVKSGVKTALITQNIPFDIQTKKANKPALTQQLYDDFAHMKVLSEQVIVVQKKKKSKTPTNKIDSATLLTMLDKTNFTTLKRSGNSWETKLGDGRSLKARVLVFAADVDLLQKELKISDLKPAAVIPFGYEENLYRTSLAGVADSNLYLPLRALLIPNQENLLIISPNSNLHVGRAVGATAAFAGFYDTKTSLSNLKQIQGELLAYKNPLVPFADISLTDSNWLVIQKIGVTGILKGEIKEGKNFFHPDKIVRYDEINQPLRDYYYKAQIWLDDHQNAPITLENTISMISYVGNKAEAATKTELQKKWNKTYKLASQFDLKKELTRREFSVILNDYLYPFDKINVDNTGRIIR
ncbi:hypothetical protein [Pedobacter sp. MW01-1-1]|uniref:hypothetical protein n=1 Tax=Pedobacter sp. MW01-1-1 TaxID=3383027 RepID=UPI003FEF0A9A